MAYILGNQDIPGDQGQPDSRNRRNEKHLSPVGETSGEWYSTDIFIDPVASVTVGAQRK